MDKVEYKIRLEEIQKLMEKQKYPDAAILADTIDWRRVKSVPVLMEISDLYSMNKRYEDCRNLLFLAYDRNPSNKTVVYKLCETYLDLGDLLNAIECYKEYAKLAGRDDTGIYTLKYRMYELQNVSLDEKIQLLEELKRKERIEEWEYELADLYHRAGYGRKCVEECDEIILWFGEGNIVTKAMELKMRHEPLSPSQQEKYNKRNEEKFVAAARVGSVAPVIDEMDIHVKTMDMSNKYSTINLQAELADNVREFLDDTGNIKPVNSFREEPVVSEPEISQTRAFDPREVRNSVYHGTIPADAKEVFFEDKTSDISYQVPVPENAGSQETPQFNAFREEFSKEMEGKEITPSYGRLDQGTDVKNDMQEIYLEPEEPVSKANNQLDSMLAQQSDGQIVMAVDPEENKVEKQITGQMNINEVLKDWEEIKKQNAQKLQEDIQRRMMAHTGEIISKLERSTNEELLRAIENADKAEKAGDSSTTETPEPVAQQGEFYGSVTGMIPGSIWKEVDAEPAEVEPQPVEHNPEEEALAEAVATVEEVQELTAETSVDEVVADEADVAGETEETALEETEEVVEESEEVPELELEQVSEEVEAAEEKVILNNTEMLENEVEKALLEDQREPVVVGSVSDSAEVKTPVLDNTTDIPVNMNETEKGSSKVTMSKEVKEMFAPFLYSKKMKKQIVNAIDNMSIAAYTGNIIISSDNEESGINLATTFVKYMKQTEGNFSGKVAKIKAVDLNKKDISTSFAKITNGAMIIEGANSLTSEVITRILQTLNQEENGYFIILVDRRNEVNKFMARSPYLKEFFNLPVDIIAMSTNMLVEFGERYAFEKGYTIDSFGLLALNKRIDDMQIGMHVVTIGEVKELVDGAIEHAEKKKVSRTLSRKRKDEEGMVILFEKDFEAK